MSSFASPLSAEKKKSGGGVETVELVPDRAGCSGGGESAGAAAKAAGDLRFAVRELSACSLRVELCCSTLLGTDQIVAQGMQKVADLHFTDAVDDSDLGMGAGSSSNSSSASSAAAAAAEAAPAAAASAGSANGAATARPGRRSTRGR
jgi:hypothetical protein